MCFVSEMAQVELKIGRVSAPDLGPIPPSEEGARRAAWVGALINPVPALGVGPAKGHSQRSSGGGGKWGWRVARSGHDR
jgi:hypothetical protein